MLRSYDDLWRIPTFEERYEYLRLGGSVGEATFGFERHLNQRFYTSSQWRRVRDVVIARDMGCDLGVEGRDIHDRVIIHHMNPITRDDIELGDEDILNPLFLITVSHDTHNAIHYGDASLLQQPPIERAPGDTRLW